MTLDNLAILIPVHNPADKLSRTLKAVAAMPHGKVVVVDDGGTEDLSVHQSIVNFDLVTIPDNVGITKALNIGLQHCFQLGVAYIARIDAGDIPVNDRFRKQIAYLENNPECQLVGCQVEVRNANGDLEFYFLNPPAPRKLKRAMYTRNAFFHCSVMFRASILQEIGVYNETFPVAQDYELFFRIAQAYEVGLVDEVLVYDLYNPKGISYSRRNEQLRAKLRVQLMYFSRCDFRSYLGIAKSIIIIALPDKLVWVIKKRFKNVLATIAVR